MLPPCLVFTTLIAQAALNLSSAAWAVAVENRDEDENRRPGEPAEKETTDVDLAPAKNESERVRLLILPPADKKEMGTAGQGAAAQDGAAQDGAAQDALYGAFAAVGIPAVARNDRDGIDLFGIAPSAQGSPDDARDALLAARAAFAGFDLDAALLELARAETVLLTLSAPELHHDLFADVLLLLAEIALAGGEIEDATQHLRRLARLQPERTKLHPGLYSPDLLAAYASARERNAAAPLATLVFWPRVSGVATWTELVDGKEHDTTVHTRTLAAGPHLLTVRAPGRLTLSTWVDLDPGHPALFEPLLTPPGISRRRQQGLLTLRSLIEAEAEREAHPSPTLSNTDKRAGQHEAQKRVQKKELIAAARRLAELCGATWLVLPGPSLRAFSSATGFVEIESSSDDPLQQARAVASAMQRARRQKEEARQAIQEAGAQSAANLNLVTPAEPDPETDLDDDDLYSLPLIGTGAGVVAIAVLAAAAATGATFAWLWYASSVRETSPAPPRSITVRFPGGA